MRYRQWIMIVIGFAASPYITGCTAQNSAAAANGRPLDDSMLTLPPQELYGLLAEVTLRVFPAPQIPTHAIDLRLTNRESLTKYNVMIDRVSLDSAVTDFRRPQTQTLWNRGSTFDYPMVASWNLSHPLPSYVLDILVRYETSGGHPVYVPFRWNVRLDVPPPLGASLRGSAAPAPGTRS